jgi:FlaG/FlaF family flagellin (archaellin)
MRKITRNKKGIDTILAALLMVVIVVVAAVMVYAWSTGLLGTLLITPNAGKETLVNDASTYAFSCPTSPCTNVTVNIRNSGTASVTLATYYVSDSSGDQWAVTSGWTNAPTLTPGQVAITKFYIGTSCTSTTTGYGSNCQYTGATGAFPGFVSGYSYTVKVVTVKGTPFSFPIQR